MSVTTNAIKSDATTQTRKNRPTREQAEQAVRTLIAWAGDDPDREGLIDTPNRVARAYEEFFGGYFLDAQQALSRTFKDTGGYDDIVFLRDIPFHSHCEHHMVPFAGKAHIAYFPADGVVGLSKLARVTDIFARRLQTQETLTVQIIEAIDKALGPLGTAVILEAEHMCMTMRGIKKHGAATITQRFTGVFADDPENRRRFFELLKTGNR